MVKNAFNHAFQNFGNRNPTRLHVIFMYRWFCILYKMRPVRADIFLNNAELKINRERAITR